MEIEMYALSVTRLFCHVSETMNSVFEKARLLCDDNGFFRDTFQREEEV